MSPSRPLRRTWLRYMPVMPATASPAIRTFKQSRTKTLVVVMDVRSSCGCPIWTPMKRAPAATAATAEARVRLVVVMVMSDSLVFGAGRVSGDVQDTRNRRGELTSPDDVSWGGDWSVVTLRAGRGPRPDAPRPGGC